MARRGRGEGTIYRGKDGRWHGEMHTPDGKLKDVYYGKTRQVVPAVRRTQKTVMSPEQVGAFIEGTRGDRFETFYLLALTTGSRRR